MFLKEISPLARISCFVLALFFVGVSAGFAGVIRDDRSDGQYLSLGASTQYASVGRLDVRMSKTTSFGSATLVASDWILTAAHVVSGATSMAFTIDGRQYTGLTWVTAPGWNGNLMAGYDLALVHLSSPVAGVTPASIYGGSGEVGGLATFVGFGKSGTGSTGATTFDLQKRAGQNMLDTAIGTASRILMADFDNPKKNVSTLGSPSPVNLEYLISSGDSGGGVFEVFSGQPMLVGVVSFGKSPTSASPTGVYGEQMGLSRVSLYDDWITSIIGGSVPVVPKPGVDMGDAILNSYGFYDLPVWDVFGVGTNVPEPATVSLLAMGGLVLANRRNRRRA